MLVSQKRQRKHTHWGKMTNNSWIIETSWFVSETRDNQAFIYSLSSLLRLPCKANLLIRSCKGFSVLLKTVYSIQWHYPPVAEKYFWNQRVAGLTYGLSWFEDDVTTVEQQQACADEDEDPQSESSLKGQRQHWQCSFQISPYKANLMCIYTETLHFKNNWGR